MRKICRVIVIFLVLVLLNNLCDGKISNLRLCADPKCAEPISLGITQVNYNPSDKYVLGFRANVHVKIFSKSAGSEPNFWGAEIQGRRGYVPKNLIREMKVLNSQLQYEVPTELGLEESGEETVIDQEASEEVNETVQEVPKIPEIAQKMDQVSVEADKEEDKESGFFSHMFGGNSVEEKQEPVKPETTTSVREDEESEEDYDEEEDDEEEEEEEEEEDVSTEETPEITEKPVNIEELAKPNEEEVFQERKILSTFEEIPQQDAGHVSSEQEIPKEPEREVKPAEVSEEIKEKEDLLPAKEPTIEVTTPHTADTHYFPEEFVTQPSVFPDKSGEEVSSTEEVPEFKPIPEEQTENKSPEEVKELQEEIPSSTEAPREERNEIPVVEVLDEILEPVINTDIPQESLPAFDTIPPLPPQIPIEEVVPDVQTPFPPLHEHLPPLPNIEPESIPEIPVVEAAKQPENIGNTAETVPEVPQTLPEVITEPPPETVTESVGQGSFEEINIKPTEEPQEEKIVKIESEKPDGGFFSGLFDSITETLNMKVMKDSEKMEQENVENKMDKDKKSTDDFFYRPQSQELRHPIVSPHHPTAQQQQRPKAEVAEEKVTKSAGMTFDEFIYLLMDSLLGMSSLILYLSVSSGAILIFTFGHYLVVQCSRERQLLFRLNSMERKLMVAFKENGSLKGELGETREKLMSIQDNSFGSNDMVIALRGELDNSEAQREHLQDQVLSLEKELENAAEAGLELNRMVSELLSNQSGSDSIISSVEELQKQLNEQQNTILTINASLAEKSRENSELQVSLASQSEKYTEEISRWQEKCEKLEVDTVEDREKKVSLMEQIDKLVKEREREVGDLKQKIQVHENRYEDISKSLTQSQSRVQVLEDCIKSLKQEVGQKGSGNFEEIMNVANLKTQLVAATKEKQMLKEKLEEEAEARKLLDDHVKIVREEVEKLRKEYNDAEKERLEAQTRLEVLTSYFKDKETQLQKELSVKEAMWMKSQGETTSTVEKIRSMQDEIQTLKSQNDALRAEIEAQRATHKAQVASLENRAQESWLSARQAERRLEESRIESSTLRRKLTSFAENGVNSSSTNNVDSLTDASSPLHGVENPGSPLLGVLPPPPFLPPPFMPPPPPFMPPGPFIPAEMRLPPLGRLMSPPPPNNRYSPGLVDDRDGRFSPDRGRYTPDRYHDRYPPHRMSPYETETDVSPPPTPPPHHRGGYRGYSAYSPPPQQHDDRMKQFKGGLSSGSADSLGPRKSGGSAKV
ncbi:transport and Golgi organization protein 1 [Phlebotomus argentipes]|uniref:transport and Golgi organization protein 1 n=1 Tax=Phlebotomus argentipes TaxID=94469 RepID=UPI002892B479|nr:transport and Golgi organization protein 1 [Phlebotomus argentipes]